MERAEVIRERIRVLREIMAERGIDAYLIPTADFHGSEYVSEFFKCREYMTGFTGSAGTAVITVEEAGLWTDGRYFVQAASELSGSGMTLYRMGEKDVPTVEEYLERKLPDGGCLAFDGRVVDGQTGAHLEEMLSKRGIRLFCEVDLVGEIWKDRPALPQGPVWILEEAYAGESAEEKIRRVREAMKEQNADIHIVTSLDDIIWLLNLRGSDVLCTPVFLSYLILTESELSLFVSREKLTPAVETYLTNLGVRILDYDKVYEAAAALESSRILLEKSCVNYQLLRSLPKTAAVVDVMNPSSRFKAVKNGTEIANLRDAHRKDGVAMVRFIRWIKEAVKQTEGEPVTELSAAAYLDGLRAEQDGFLDLSFPTISAYGANAAMCHYSATEESNAVLKPAGLFLVDSGGQYLEGTTDITRTIALGPLTEKEKEYFTLVSCGMLRLLDMQFPSGCHGFNVDLAARELLWKRGLDYNHGTGHGVGYLGVVHERPNSIRWRVAAGKPDRSVFEAGMVTSDEPGLYLEGEFGIRTENLMLCVEAEKTEFGQFLRFENLTWVPIDLDAIVPELLEPRDRRLLNDYHKGVYENLAPYLKEDERLWLREATREI